MGRPLTAAERAELRGRAYELSLRGRSVRSIGQELGISSKTVSGMLKEEGSRRAAERPDRAQWARDAYMKVADRCWKELDKDPPAYAVAQLAHAASSALDSITLLDGSRAPSKSQRELTVEVAFDRAFGEGLARLSQEELSVLSLLIAKCDGRFHDDIAAMVRRGSVALSEADDILELEGNGY